MLELRIGLLVGCFPFNYARLFFAQRKSELRLELDRARHDPEVKHPVTWSWTVRDTATVGQVGHPGRMMPR